MFFPELALFYTAFSKIAFTIILSYILFGFKNIKYLLKNSIMLIIVSLILCGTIWIIIGITGISEKAGGIISNGILYMDLNPVILLAGIVFSCFLSIFFSLNESEKKHIKQLSFKINNISYQLNVLLDTGCNLTSKDDTPVIIAEYGIFENNFLTDILPELNRELIEYSTVSSENEFLTIFRPDIITDTKKNKYNAYIGISKVSKLSKQNKFNAVMNPSVLNNKITNKENN